MSFTNLTPDSNPDGSPLMNPGITSGTRYFYFTFKPLTATVDLYFARNIYSNEEFISRIFTPNSPTSLLTTENVSNLVMPISFRGNQLSITTPSGSTYTNNSMLPNCKINNFNPGTTYILESRTLYNDRGQDFSVIMKSGQTVLGLNYIQTSTTPMTPTISLPPAPSPPPTPTTPGIPPPVPTALSASNITAGCMLSWSPSANATGYNVYRGGILLASPMGATNTSCIDSHIVSGNSYMYAVSAINSGGESAKSAPVTHMASFQFTSLTPDLLPGGPSITGPVLRYYYFLFTPITPSLDFYLCANGNSKEEAIIGLYDTTAPASNLFVSGNISNLDSNVNFGIQQLGTTNPIGIPGLAVSRTIPGMYVNNGTTPNFRMNNLVGSLDAPNAILKTYILELVSVNNDMDFVAPDFGAYCKNVSNTIHNGFPTQLIFNSVSSTRGLPSPYVINYNFATTSAANYTSYIFPYLYVFQHVKNVLESMISKSTGARATGRSNDMLVNFKVDALSTGVIGESSLTGWNVGSGRSPDFTYEQDITFSNANFTNGYFTGAASFNGATTVNGRANIALFGTLLHEMLHGIGIFYNSSYNAGNSDVGWTPLLTNVDQNDAWYKGPATGSSSALTNYIQYVGNTAIQRIPIENDYGAGTALSHWDEGDSTGSTSQFRKFNNVYCPALKLEIMTGFLNKNDYLTGLTAGALKDYGYNVNMLSPYIVHYPSGLIPVSPLQRYSLQEYVELASQPAFKCQCIQEGNKVKHRIVDQSVKMCMSTMSTMSQRMCMSTTSMSMCMSTMSMMPQSTITLPMSRNNLYVSPWWYNNLPYENCGCIWLSPYQTYPTYPIYYP